MSLGPISILTDGSYVMDANLNIAQNCVFCYMLFIHGASDWIQMEKKTFHKADICDHLLL